jgi:hypothetical protein
VVQAKIGERNEASPGVALLDVNVLIALSASTCSPQTSAALEAPAGPTQGRPHSADTEGLPSGA